MKLQTKIIITVVSVFVISLLFTGVLIFSNTKTNMQNQIANQLTSTSQIIENHINDFLEQQENKLKLVATQSDLSNEE